MQHNQNKTNDAPPTRDGMTYFDSKNNSSSIVSVVKTEIYPEKRKKKGKESDSPSSSRYQSSTDGTRIITDPNGSYTGTPIVESEVPVQDVDDL